MEVIQLTAIYSADTDDESHEVQEEEEFRVVRWTSGQDTVEESSENSGAVQETTENIVENMANGVLPDKAVVRSEEVSGSSRDGCEGQTSDHRQEIKIAYFFYFFWEGGETSAVEDVCPVGPGLGLFRLDPDQV